MNNSNPHWPLCCRRSSRTLALHVAMQRFYRNDKESQRKKQCTTQQLSKEKGKVLEGNKNIPSSTLYKKEVLLAEHFHVHAVDLRRGGLAVVDRGQGGGQRRGPGARCLSPSCAGHGRAALPCGLARARAHRREVWAVDVRGGCRHVGQADNTRGCDDRARWLRCVRCSRAAVVCDAA